MSNPEGFFFPFSLSLHLPFSVASLTWIHPILIPHLFLQHAIVLLPFFHVFCPSLTWDLSLRSSLCTGLLDPLFLFAMTRIKLGFFFSLSKCLLSNRKYRKTQCHIDQECLVSWTDILSCSCYNINDQIIQWRSFLCSKQRVRNSSKTVNRLSLPTPPLGIYCVVRNTAISITCITTCPKSMGKQIVSWIIEGSYGEYLV